MQKQLTALKKQFRVIQESKDINEIERTTALDRLAARINQLEVSRRDMKDGDYLPRRTTEDVINRVGGTINSAIVEWNYDNSALSSGQVEGLIDHIAKSMTDAARNLPTESNQ